MSINDNPHKFNTYQFAVCALSNFVTLSDATAKLDELNDKHSRACQELRDLRRENEKIKEACDWGNAFAKGILRTNIKLLAEITRLKAKITEKGYVPAPGDVFTVGPNKVCSDRSYQDREWKCLSNNGLTLEIQGTEYTPHRYNFCGTDKKRRITVSDFDFAKVEQQIAAPEVRQKQEEKGLTALEVKEKYGVDLDKPIIAESGGAIYLLIPNLASDSYQAVNGYNWFNLAEGRLNSCRTWPTAAEVLAAYNSCYSFSNPDAQHVVRY